MLEGCTPWPADFAARYRAAGYWRGITLVDLLHQAAARDPDKVALVFGAERLTYRALIEGADRLAVRLAELGLAPRDRVVFQLANSATFFLVFFALLRLGVIPVLALPAHRRAEIEHFFRFAEAKAYLIPDRHRDFDYRPLAEAVRATAPSLAHVLVLGEPGPGQRDLGALIGAGASADEVTALHRGAPHDPGEVALMLLSGGTTGMPKLIPRTHDDYVYNCSQCGAVLGFGAETVFLAMLPLAHNWTLASPGVLATLAHGGTAVIAPDTRPEAIFPLIARERVNVVAAAVPLVVNWLAGDWPERVDLSSLRLFMSGGAKLIPALRREVEKRLRCAYVESFGTGEGLLNKTRPDDPDTVRFESSGRPISPGDEIKVIDEAGRELPEGEIGELAARGPYTIRGYYKAPEATAKAFTKDGFYRMGDAARIIGGNIYLEGRLKDLINRGGEKISCEEIENHLISHPAIANVCVVAMPDPVFGEKACAFVVARPGARLALDDLKAHLAATGVAKFKWPERLELIDAFPLSPAGKILRRELRERIARKIEA